MNKYIAMVILKPDISKTQLDFIQSNIIRLFEENTKVKKVWILGKRKLDYKIKKNTEGLYLKFEIFAKSKKLDKIKELLKDNQNVIFSIIINDDSSENKVPMILKKRPVSLPFTKIPNNLEVNDSNKKVYMLVSKNARLPFSTSDILAVSEKEKNIYEYANKKISEYIFAKGYKTTKNLKFIKDIENELKRSWKVDFILNDNTNVVQQLLIQEKKLI